MDSNEIKGDQMKMEGIYSRDLNIQDILEDIPYPRGLLVLENEVRSAVWSLPSWKVTQIEGLLPETRQAAEKGVINALTMLCQLIWHQRSNQLIGRGQSTLYFSS